MYIKTQAVHLFLHFSECMLYFNEMYQQKLHKEKIKQKTYLSEMHTEIFITEILKWCLGFANKNVVAKAKNGCGYRWKKTGLTWKTQNGESVHLTKVKWTCEQLYHRFKIKDVKGYPFPTFPLCSHNINNKSHYFQWH